MSTEIDTLALLERALHQTADIVAAIRPEQSSLPTPCSDWDVRALVRHVVVQDLQNFTLRARGETVAFQAPAGELGDDWAGAFRDGADRLLETWRAADLDSLVPMRGDGEAPLRTVADQQITEFAVHGWDLVRATGQGSDLDPALAEHALRWAHQMLRPEFRGPDQAFGAEVPVPEDAPVYDRLAGWFGRDPGWKPEP